VKKIAGLKAASCGIAFLYYTLPNRII